jgi:nucleotide-binding universal stress UspA family protein
MYYSILVPLDGSAFAEQALPLACEIARRAGATLRLVHVHVPYTANPIYVEGVPVIDDQLRSLGQEHARAYLEQLRERLHGETAIPITTALLSTPGPGARDGTIAQVLAAHIAATPPDLIVMTTHGRGGPARFWLGSVTDSLLRWSNAPILLLRPHEAARADDRAPSIQHILIPLDGSGRSEAIMEHAMALGRLMHAEYTLLCVVAPSMPGAAAPFTVPTDFDPDRTMRLQTEAQHYLDSIARPLQAAGTTVHTRVSNSARVADTILEEASRHGIDMIAMSTHGRGGLARLLIGSVADKVLRGTNLPMLVHRPPEPDDSNWRY